MNACQTDVEEYGRAGRASSEGSWTIVALPPSSSRTRTNRLAERRLMHPSASAMVGLSLSGYTLAAAHNMAVGPGRLALTGRLLDTEPGYCASRDTSSSCTCRIASMTAAAARSTRHSYISVSHPGLGLRLARQSWRGRPLGRRWLADRVALMRADHGPRRALVTVLRVWVRDTAALPVG
jgi:hypothetical protein